MKHSLLWKIVFGEQLVFGGSLDLQGCMYVLSISGCLKATPTTPREKKQEDGPKTARSGWAPRKNSNFPQCNAMQWNIWVDHRREIIPLIGLHPSFLFMSLSCFFRGCLSLRFCGFLRRDYHDYHLQLVRIRWKFWRSSPLGCRVNGWSTYPHVRYPHEKSSINKALSREQLCLTTPDSPKIPRQLLWVVEL